MPNLENAQMEFPWNLTPNFRLPPEFSPDPWLGLKALIINGRIRAEEK